MPDPLLNNPAVQSLAIQVAPLRRDRLDLQRLIERYGERLTLWQALVVLLRVGLALGRERLSIQIGNALGLINAGLVLAAWWWVK